MKLWDELSELQKNLENKKSSGNKHTEEWRANEWSNLRRFVGGSDYALKDAVRWNKLGDGINKLRAGLGKSSSMPHPIFFLIVFAIPVALLAGTSPGFGFILGLAAIVGLVHIVNNMQIAGLKGDVKLKLMRFQRINRESKFPVEFSYLQYNSKSDIVHEETFSLEEGAVRVPGDGGCGIGFFNKTEQLIGFICIDQSGKFLFTFNEGDGSINLKNEVLLPSFDQFLTNEIGARNSLTEIVSFDTKKEKSSNSTFSMDALKIAWSKVVLREDEMENLVRAELLFAYSDPSAPRGILLKGPPGTGKSLSAQIFAESSGAHFFKLSIADMKGEHIGSSAANVKRLWQEARENAPSVIFIDECEGVFAKRGSDQGDSFVNEVVQTFLTEWDGIGGDSNVLIIGATNRAELLDDAIVSRFTDILELLPTDSVGMIPLIEAVIRQLGLSVSVPAEVAASMSGMNGREVRNVIQQAMRLAAPNAPTTSNFETAIGKIRGKNSTKVEDGASWDTLILPDQLKTKIKTLSQMIREAGALAANGVPVPRTLLLYGPPGTGKTQIARTMANESGVNFISRSTADLKGQYLGHAASRISQAFETARSSSPSILFIDEIDALASSRGSSGDQLQAEAVTQLLQELDGVSSKSGFVLVVAATNLMDQLDSAILSRFSQKLEIPLPSQNERAAILQTLLNGKPVGDDIDVHHVASICEGFSGRDIRELISQAFNLAFQRTMAEGKSAADLLMNMADLKGAIAQD